MNKHFVPKYAAFFNYSVHNIRLYLPELLFEVVHGLSSGLTAACEAEYNPDYEPKKGYRPMRDVKLSRIWEGMEEAYGILIEEYGEDVTLHELAHAKAE